MAESFRHRLSGIRPRTTLIAVLTVGLALIVGGVGLVVAMRMSLTDQLRSTAQVRARQAQAALEAGSPPGVVVVETDEQLVQVLDGRGRVVAASASARRLPPLGLQPGTSKQIHPQGADEDFVFVAVRAVTGDGARTVIVGRGLGDVGDATHVLGQLLLIGLPLVLIATATAVWAATGRALRPVERIRAEVDAISGADLQRRVPEPAGRDEIARLAGTMNGMLGRLDASQRRQRRFVSDASHELRSPVASIREHAEVALAHPERTTVAALAETVLAEDLRVQHLVEALLILARADEHTLLVQGRPVDVDDLVFDEATRLRDTGRVQVDTTGVSAARVHGDRDALGRALRNLGDNALRHARSRVSLVLSQINGTVTLSVDDDGLGIPEAERGRVLGRFVRLDEARARDGGGSGLGLAIVDEVVRAHGGHVAIGGSPLGGARVEVRIPAEPG